MFLVRANARDTKWMLCFHAAQTGKHLLRTQNVSEQSQKHILCPGLKICVRNKCCARGQTGKHLCRQQCVLVCQGLIHINPSRNRSFSKMFFKREEFENVVIIMWFPCQSFSSNKSPICITGDCCVFKFLWLFCRRKTFDAFLEWKRRVQISLA